MIITVLKIRSVMIEMMEDYNDDNDYNAEKYDDD